jgi:hypothetical protein
MDNPQAGQHNCPSTQATVIASELDALAWQQHQEKNWFLWWHFVPPEVQEAQSNPPPLEDSGGSTVPSGGSGGTSRGTAIHLEDQEAQWSI